MENLIETNKIWRERVMTFRKLDRQVKRLLKDRRPLEKRIASWMKIFTDLVIDNYHQDMILGRRLKEK